MYAKLALSTAFTPATAQTCIRDIMRLLTSNSPSVSLLSSSGGFNVGASSIIDATPAGWTYVGSNSADGSTLPSAGSGTIASDTSANGLQWVASAPCAAPNASKLKYCVLGVAGMENLGYVPDQYYNYGIYVAGATGANALGVVTNHGPAVVETNQAAGSAGFTFNLQIATTYHLIANARHVTLIAEGHGVGAVWEHTYSEVHQFLNQIPMVQFCQYGASSIAATSGGTTLTGKTVSLINQSTSAYPNSHFVMAMFNATNISTGTTYGVFPFGSMTRPYQPYAFPHQGVKGVSVSANGLNRNIVNPVMFNHFEFGYPTIYVTGVVPVYMCRGGIGSPGDVININGTDYIYFPVNSSFGLAMLTN